MNFFILLTDSNPKTKENQMRLNSSGNMPNSYEKLAFPKIVFLSRAEEALVIELGPMKRELPEERINHRNIAIGFGVY